MSLATKGYQILRKEGFVNFSVKGAKYAIKKAKHQTYKIGTDRVCPICNFSGRAFATAGARSRKDAECINCGARERHRLLWQYIKDKTDWTEGDKHILYFAPTDSIAKKLRESGCNITTVDLTGNVDVNLDITHLPFNKNKFDGLICSHVLEHISNDRAAMSEMHRILTANGDGLVMVPKSKTRQNTYEDESITSPKERKKEFGTRYHVRVYGLDFSQRLSEAGFEVSVVTYARELGGKATQKYGLKIDEQFLEREFEDIHHCKKTIPQSD